MITAPSPTSVALLLGLSFFLGLAFEEFFAHTDERRPGGIRTFPLLALAGGALYLFDPVHFLPFTAGLLVLGAWLFVYYGAHVSEHEKQADDDGNSDINVGLVVPVLNVLAYVLGAAALALPPWVAVTFTVAAVLLLTGRERLHALARRIEIKEIVTAGEFLILTGIVLPLLPNHPVTALTEITPRQVWLALIVVCSFSYASYLAQRYWAAAAGGLWMAALGGMYSSTATTVVLARQAKADPTLKRQAQAGITLATAIMYLRILAVVAIFNIGLGTGLGLAARRAFARRLCDLRLAISARQAGARCAETGCHAARRERQPARTRRGGCVRGFVRRGLRRLRRGQSQFGISGIYGLAAIVGVTDIDPFVLNLAQGGVGGLPKVQLAAAILIAASSNNVLKAVYAASFAGGKATAGSSAALVMLAVAGGAIAIAMAMWPL